MEGAAEITKAAPEKQTVNGDAEEASGTDISSWVSCEDGNVSFTLKDAAAYRVKGASKATPGFDVMDYGRKPMSSATPPRTHAILTNMS